MRIIRPDSLGDLEKRSETGEITAVEAAEGIPGCRSKQQKRLIHAYVTVDEEGALKQCRRRCRNRLRHGDSDRSPGRCSGCH